MSSYSSIPPDSSTRTINGSIHDDDEASRGNVDFELQSFGSTNNNISPLSSAGDTDCSNIMAEDALYSEAQKEDDDEDLTPQTTSSSSANTDSGVSIGVASDKTPSYSAEAESSVGPEINGDGTTHPPVPTGMHSAMLSAPPMPMALAPVAPMPPSRPMGLPFVYPDTGPLPRVAMSMTDVAAADRDSAVKSKSLSGIESMKDGKGPPPPIAMTDAAKPEEGTFLKRWFGGLKKPAKVEQINDSTGPPDLPTGDTYEAAAESLLKKPTIPNFTVVSNTVLEASLGTPLEPMPSEPSPEAPEDEESPPDPASVDESIVELAEEQEPEHNELDFDPQIRVPEAYLVVDDDTRHSRNIDVPVEVPVYAVPVPIWYRQKRIQIVISLVCVVVAVLAIALGATMMSPSETTTMIVIDDSPTPEPSMSLSPSTSSSPSYHPTLDPSNVPSQSPTTCMKRREIVLPDANSDINMQFGATNRYDTVAVVIAEYSEQDNEDRFVSWGGIQLVETTDRDWTFESAEQSRIRLLPSNETRIVEFVARVAISNDALLVGYHWKDEDSVHTDGALLFRKSSIDQVWREEARLEPSDGYAYDGAFGSKRFGTSVALEDNTAIVGAPLDSHDNGIGAAYIFFRSYVDNIWAQQAKLLPTGGSNFGTSVALSTNIVLISSHVEGSVYVYVRDGSIWKEEAKLLPNDITPGDYFGLGLALKRNSHALIGAPKKDRGKGTVYVFRRQWNNTWIEETKLTPASLSEGDQFGRALSFSDGAFDGIVVGAPGHKSKGAVFNFKWDSSTWKEQLNTLFLPEGPSVFDNGETQDRTAEEQFGNFVVPAMLGNMFVGMNAGYRLNGGDCVFNICVSTSYAASYVFNVCMDVKGGDEVPVLAASSTSTSVSTTSLRPTGSPSISSVPTDTCHLVEIRIKFDGFPQETYWELKRTSDDAVVKAYQAGDGDKFYIESLCLQEGRFGFTIYDSYGDGICCGTEGRGNYTLTSSANGVVMIHGGGNFGSNETSLFDIPFLS